MQTQTEDRWRYRGFQEALAGNNRLPSLKTVNRHQILLSRSFMATVAPWRSASTSREKDLRQALSSHSPIMLSKNQKRVSYIIGWPILYHR